MSDPFEPRPGLDPATMLRELNAAPKATEDRRKILEHFAAGVDPLFRLIVEARGPHRGEGERAFAIFHLLCRSLSDLLAAAHLAEHAYLQQAYSLVRPVHEHCELIELFAEQPEQAAEWVNSAEPEKDFRPARVRQLLGGTGQPEEIYGHLSEMGPHPRFAGSRLAGLMRIRGEGVEPGDKQAILRIGSFFDQHPASVHVYGFIFEALIRVGFKARHLECVTEAVTAQTWLDAFVPSVAAISGGCKAMRRELISLNAAENSEFLDSIYDDLLAQLKTASDPP